MIEDTVRTWAATWSEPDAARRAALLATCFAPTGRFVSSGITTVGHSALLDYMARLHARVAGITARITSPIDIQGSLFRVRAVAETPDRVIGANWDAGEVDANGLITTVFTFAD